VRVARFIVSAIRTVIVLAVLAYGVMVHLARCWRMEFWLWRLRRSVGTRDYPRLHMRVAHELKRFKLLEGGADAQPQ